MKTHLHFKLIATLITLSILGLLIFQGYWLSDVYHSQQESLQKELKEAMMMADYQELFDRIDSIKLKGNLYSEFNNSGKEAQSAMVVDSTNSQKPLGSLRVSIDSFDPEKETENSDSDMESQDLQSYLSAISNIENMLLFTLHSFVDTISPINIAKYDSLLHAEMDKRQIYSPYELSIDYIISNPDSLLTMTLQMSDDKGIYLDYPIGHPAGKIIHLHIEDPFKVVVRQMAGILASSVMLLLLILFAFVYLLKTILKQKTVEELKTDFTNNMTHELKTPISVSFAAVDAMLNFNDNVDDKQRRYLSIAKEQLIHLTGLVEQILSLAVENRSTFRLNIEDIDLKPLVDSIFQQYRLKAKRPIDLTMEISDGFTIKADRTHLYNMLSNLIDNAIKYSDKESCYITVKAESSIQELRLSVSDNGTGISETNQKHIFEKFFRVPNGSMHNVKGYGLGLYYVSDMMQKHHGWVDLTSRVGKGSTFTLHFKPYNN